MLTERELKAKLYYNPFTGIFSRTLMNGKIKEYNSANSKGYITIRINNRMYMASHLAFLYMTGALPTSIVDHANGIPSDDRWGNLRQATATQNSQNRATYSNNKSGRTGVVFVKSRNRWMSSITVNKKLIERKYWKTLEEACCARDKLEVKYFGDFSPMRRV